MKPCCVPMWWMVTLSCAFAPQHLQTAVADMPTSVPNSKRTMLGLYLTSSEAYAKWAANPDDVIILDVRTPEEYVFVGHPEMAWNVPLKLVAYESDGERSKLALKRSSSFVSQVKQIAKTTDLVAVICRSGSRSATATNLLAQAGFNHVFNVIDGFEGEKVDDRGSVFNGKRMKNGWKNAGLPWTCDVVPGRMRLPIPPADRHGQCVAD